MTVTCMIRYQIDPFQRRTNFAMAEHERFILREERNFVEAVAGRSVFTLRFRRGEPATSGDAKRGAVSRVHSQSGVDARAQSIARSSKRSRSRTFRVSEAARSNSSRASPNRPSFLSRSPRTLGNR